jgi:plastocyanin
MRPDIVEAPVGGAASVSASASSSPANLPSGPLLARVLALREAAAFLEKAGAARVAGNRGLADVLFSSAELILGIAAVADLAPLFREGAPPRVTTPLKTIPKDSPPQPVAVGSSEEEQAPGQAQSIDQPSPQPKVGSLSGTVVLSGGRPLQGMAVVTLEPASGKIRRRSPKQRIIEQRNREFFPKVLAIPIGSTVTFPNFDNVFHNVFSRSEAHPFDLGIYRAGQARELTFDKEGVIRIGCNLHANMSAYVVTVSAPHYGITDARGRFRFRSLDPGRYRMRVWSEYVETPLVQEIEIKPTQNEVTATLVFDRAAGPLADKFGAIRVGAARK